MSEWLTTFLPHSELKGIAVGRIMQNVSISSDSVYDSAAYDPVEKKAKLSKWEQK